MIPMLRRYKEQDTKLFLLTNSFWEYTSTAMNYLYHEEKVDDELQKKNEWIELFDLVYVNCAVTCFVFVLVLSLFKLYSLIFSFSIAGSCKPAFMLDPYLQLFRVNMPDGSLKNTDGVFEIDALGPNGAEKFLEKGKIFQGGNWQHLHKVSVARVVCAPCVCGH
jgi:5'-nucleotidase